MARKQFSTLATCSWNEKDPVMLTAVMEMAPMYHGEGGIRLFSTSESRRNLMFPSLDIFRMTEGLDPTEFLSSASLFASDMELNYRMSRAPDVAPSVLNCCSSSRRLARMCFAYLMFRGVTVPFPAVLFSRELEFTAEYVTLLWR